MRKLIEFACSHNQGRSPLAEAFARQYLASLGNAEYGVISSGTQVNHINLILTGEKELPFDWIKYCIEKCYARGLRDSRLKDLVQLEKEKIPPKDLDLIKRTGYENIRMFVAEEKEYREEAFKRYDLGTPKQTQDQTISNPRTVLLLGMGLEIETLAGYATHKSGAEFKSGFGGELTDYLTMAETIRGYTHLSIDRFLGV